MLPHTALNQTVVSRFGGKRLAVLSKHKYKVPSGSPLLKKRLKNCSCLGGGRGMHDGIGLACPNRLAAVAVAWRGFRVSAPGSGPQCLVTEVWLLLLHGSKSSSRILSRLHALKAP